MSNWEIVGGSDGGAGGGGGGGGTVSGAGLGSGNAAVYQGTSDAEAGDFAVAYASATTLTLSELQFQAVLENFVAVYEYDGDNLIKSYTIDDDNYDWSWAPAADASTGTLTVDAAAFDAASTFVVVMVGPERDVLDVMTDFGGPGVHRSPRDFSVAWASATTLDFTAMAMDPDVDQIMAVVEIATGGKIRMTYTRREWAFTWVAGAAGEGVLTIASATMQPTSTFVAFIEAHDFSTDAANTARTTATLVKPTQNIGADGNATPSGYDAGAPIIIRQIGALAQMNGDNIYKSPIHFTAAYQSATEVDLSGHPTVTDVTQFLAVKQVSSAGVVTIHFPHLSTGAFSWDAVNDRLTVANATFANTDVFQVILEAENRYASDPSNLLVVGEASPYPLRADDAAIPLIVAAQDFTAAFVDLGPEIPMFGYNKLKLWLTFDINDSTDLQVRVLEKHESGGTEEYQSIIETYGTSDIKFQAGYWELNVDADGLYPLVYSGDGMTPYLQVQIKAGTLGGGTDAQMDAAYYTRGAFG